MNRLKLFFLDLIKNPGKAFLTAALINISILIVEYIFTMLNLPEIASESDNLSQGQILIGFILGILRLVLSILSPIFSTIFVVSLFFMVYRIVKPATK